MGSPGLVEGKCVVYLMIRARTIALQTSNVHVGKICRSKDMLVR